MAHESCGTEYSDYKWPEAINAVHSTACIMMLCSAFQSGYSKQILTSLHK